VIDRIKELNKINVPQAALILMLLGIMAPPVMYALNLSTATPTQLITSICMSLFGSVLFLWILDATSILKFRSKWVSRSVYSIGVASIISATIGIYKDAFSKHLHPFDGAWQMTCWSGTGERLAEDQPVILYSNNGGKTYFGYSGCRLGKLVPTNSIRHFRVERFDPTFKQMILTIWEGDLHPDADTITHNLKEGTVAKDASYIEFRCHPDIGGNSDRFAFTRP
jgi:hypothetical protein